ncbi:hypothetical protein [Halorhodospira halochloris]|uniref:hypothetical protein n=1 Tax=Halorhodospira halochloris TaxID=1052 RepID=UPI001EE840DC|nr:hypothetical protein [Halorhodospira halochloris]MCG5549312.1 hypothetical protein [Halorhodospira halochloris]
MTITDIPLVGWLAALAVLLLLAGWLVYALRARGHEYGLKFFLSVPFALLFLISTATYVAAAAPFIIMDEGIREVAWENIVWGSSIYLAAMVLSYISNSLRSNFLFAIPYTLAQGVVASLSALIAVFLLLRHFDKDKKIKQNI